MQEPEEEVAPEVDTPIAELFARDPFDHSKQSIDAMIKKFRSMRHRFKAGEKSAGSTKPKSKTQKAQEAAMAIGKDLLSDLDL